MCRRLCFMFSVVLAIGLATGAQGQTTIDSFESGVGDWEVIYPAVESLAQSTTGVTDGTYSMERNFRGNWSEVDLDLDWSFLAVLNANDTIEVDITTSETGEGVGWWLQAALIIQGGSAGGAGYYLQSGETVIISPDGSLTTTTVSFDYGSLMTDGAWTDWAKVRLVTNGGGDGTLYYDNLRVETDDVLPKAIDYVIGDFEDDTFDGWYLDAGSPAGSTIITDPNTGVTLNDQSLRLHMPGGGWGQALRYDFDLSNAELVNAFRKAGKFQLDVTRLAAEWIDTVGLGQHGGLHLIVNTDGVWDDLGYTAWWINDNGDETTTAEWDYTSSLAQIDFDTVSYLEFFIISNYDGYDEGGIYYIDNCRFPLDLIATQPSPSNGSWDQSRDVDLSWKQGAYATERDIFFGADEAAVTAATKDDYGVLQYQRLSVTDFDPGTLDLGTTYFWRVDAGDTDPNVFYTGDVWNFTVGNFNIIDDFESYSDDPNSEVFYFWKGSDEANNSITVGNPDPPFCETTIVHGGNQSMPLYYDPNGFGDDSEARLTLTSLRNLTEDDMGALSVWFRGEATNDAEPLYLTLSNSDGRSATLTHPNPNAVQISEWTEWRVALVDFIDPDVVDLTDIDTIAVGIANNISGKGKLYVDNIRLYQRDCVLATRTPAFAAIDYAPAGDPAGDCVIDNQELAIMVNDWLQADEIIAATDPGTAGLVGYYPLDGDPNDVSGEGHHGTISGSVQWVPGVNGASQAVEFDGAGGGYVDLGIWDPNTGELSIAVWMKWNGLNGEWQGVLAKRDGWSNTSTMWQMELNNNTGSIGFGQYDSNPDFGTNIPFEGEWMHVAVTFDGTTATMYVRGKSVGSSTYFFGPATDAQINIGSVDNGSNSFNGAIDEVYIYSRALSADEIAYLADTTPGDNELYYSIISDAELYDAEAPGSRRINLRDFALLASAWLSEQMWP